VLDGNDRETIAASIQQLAEDVILSALQFWIERSGMRRLALCGGLFANVRLNRLLAESLPLDEIFIFPAMGADGLAVGNALAFLLHRDGLTTWLSRRRRLDDVYLGRDYDGVIDQCLGSAAGVKRHGGDPASLPARQIASFASPVCCASRELAHLLGPET